SYAIGLRRSIAHNEISQLTFRGFDRVINLAHRRLDHLGNFGHDGAFGNSIDGLGNNPQRLPHLLHPDDVPVISIAALPNWYFEIEISVSSIGLRFAHIPLHTAGTQHGPRDSSRYAIPCRDP